MSELIPLMPESFNQYFEPFFGGGALFFALKPSPATLTDLNPELINLYKVIRDKPNKLIKHLSTHVNDSDYYYEIRLLDRDEEVFSSLTDVERASRFMYLNKTGYNGLWRVNSKGQNNVPFGRYTNPNILDSENIKACAIALKHSEIRCTDFTYVKNKVGEGDFVYFDPPYYPVNETSNFTNYTKLGFGEDMQVRLKEL